jgi:hypothetical protein
LSLEWLVGVHDYTAKLIKVHPDVYESAWILCDPRLRQECRFEIALRSMLLICGKKKNR